MNDMRMVKYEMFIEDIDSKIKNSVSSFGGIIGRPIGVVAASGSSSGNTALALIYDYNKCNDYAKVIMDKSTLDDRFTELWKRDYPTYGEFKDSKRTIEASKKFVQICRKTENADEGYKFIFWALMILTVDKSDAENHLALICDFAKMLRITEDEFEDIIWTVKVVYNEVKTGYRYKSRKIPFLFGSLSDYWDI